MENKFRNEMEIELAGEKILLRPTFENMSIMEGDLGSISSLVFKYGRNLDKTSLNENAMMLTLPPMSHTAKIIFYNQAEKKFTLDEIFDMCLSEGAKAGAQILLFLVRCTSGNKAAQNPSEKQKKNSSKKNLVENP